MNEFEKQTVKGRTTVRLLRSLCETRSLRVVFADNKKLCKTYLAEFFIVAFSYNKDGAANRI